VGGFWWNFSLRQNKSVESTVSLTNLSDSAQWNLCGYFFTLTFMCTFLFETEL